MSDEKNMGHDLNVKDEKGITRGMTGENPEHAPQPGKKTPQKDDVDKMRSTKAARKSMTMAKMKTTRNSFS